MSTEHTTAKDIGDGAAPISNVRGHGYEDWGLPRFGQLLLVVGPTNRVAATLVLRRCISPEGHRPGGCFGAIMLPDAVRCS
jgi:hypothetical protein